MKVSFVIPIFNHWSLINTLLVDVYEHCSADEVIVVDDCSNQEEVLNGLAWWKQTHGIKILRPNENLKFLRASNYGLQKATGDVLCLISSDVRIYKDLALIARGVPLVPDKILLGGKVYFESTGWNDFNGKIFPYVEGWLLIAAKENWQELDFFDERYAPNDFEDVDLSTTALSKGYKLAQVTPDAGTVVEHIGAQTIGYTDERMKITEANREKFRLKWMNSETNS